MVHPSDPITDIKPDPDSYPPFKRLDETLIQQIASNIPDSPSNAPLHVVGALTKSLCYINRLQPSDPRIVILSLSPDQPTDYIPIMNAIFSAQKLKVTIDVCKLNPPHSVFLQQAAHLTGGSYIYLDRTDALLQYLTMAFLPPPDIRNILAVPTQHKIDFRAACFCHKNIIDIGFVCSVCLSIFCQPVPVCSTCRTKFPIKTLQRLNASRPSPAPKPPLNGTSNGTPAPR